MDNVGNKPCSTFAASTYSSILTAICIPLIAALLRFILQPALISRLPIEYDEEVLLQSPSAKDRPILSIVIPAYNEEARLLAMFEVTYHFFKQEREDLCSQLLGCAGGSFEFVIVDDGSTDSTCSIVRGEILSQMKEESHQDSLKLLRFQKNRGKGAAVQMGMLCATGNYVLMADADGATDIRDLFKLISAVTEIQQQHKNQSSIVVFGSRAHLQEVAGVERSKVRTLLMRAFHMCVAMLCSRQIQDTQCGFKLFTYSAAQKLFSNLHLQRWAFDIELVTINELLQFPIAEVGVRWKEVDGSKLDTGSKWKLIFVSIEMLRDMVCVRLCYTLGLWKLKR
mmetsp:Transcript_4989/g.7367  ORF Transcript_4989/g.7367 Transcript_4989/m.7367 type:complete len:339 (+) Transcript_4989:30-1046(+)